jgi:thymidine phosphorylase
VALDARGLGEGAARLGVGRGTIGGTVDPAAGIILKTDRGEQVRAGAELCELRAADEAQIDDALPLVEAAIRIGDAPPPSRPASPILA